MRKWRNCTFLEYAATVRDGVKCLAQRDKVMAIETVTSEIDLFVSSMGIFNINTLDHIKMLKNISLVENTGTFTTGSTRLPQALEKGMKMAT